MNPYLLKEQTLQTSEIKKNETLFTLGNGHIGTRGSLEESYRSPRYTENSGTYMNGFFESDPITYGEAAYGYAKNSQTICKLPNGKQLCFSIDGDWFSLDQGTTADHQRTFDMKQGLLIRQFTWESPAGKKVKVLIERMVSHIYPEFLISRCQITPLNFNGQIIVEHRLEYEKESAQLDDSGLQIEDPRVANRKEEQRLLIENLDFQNRAFMKLTAKHSQLSIFCTQFSKIVKGGQMNQEINKQQECWQTQKIFEAKQSEPIELIIYTGYSSFANTETEQKQNLAKLKEQSDLVENLAWNQLLDSQIDYLNQFWHLGEVEITGDNLLQQGIYFNLYHLLQAAGKDGRTNIAAKGLTGDGYEGHYFWDTEMYMLPYFIFTQPKIAKKLLMYRYHILNNARKRAKEVGINEGALFPWRTIDGEECSAYYPAGTAQFHINGDIAYAVSLYDSVVQDDDFMIQYGIDILIETARFWYAFGDFIPEKENKFCLNCVTGPDEYTALVNNNYYTNLMAQANLTAAYSKLLEWKENKPDCYQKIMERLAVKPQELENWQQAAEKMYFPYDEKRQLTLQDDQMLNRAVWPFEETPADHYPLLLHYHPLTIYRYQVNKQADTILGEMLFSDRFSLEQKKRDFDYYETVTTHDSSLSKSIFGIVASEIGEDEKAYDYFMSAALMDLEDLHHNTKDGIHAANMGGTWLGLIYGFAGLRIKDNQLHFHPNIPEKWRSITFRLHFQGREIQASLTKEQTRFELLSGAPLTIYVDEQALILS